MPIKWGSMMSALDGQSRFSSGGPGLTSRMSGLASRFEFAWPPPQVLDGESGSQALQIRVGLVLRAQFINPVYFDPIQSPLLLLGLLRVSKSSRSGVPLWNVYSILFAAHRILLPSQQVTSVDSQMLMSSFSKRWIDGMGIGNLGDCRYRCQSTSNIVPQRRIST